MLLLIFVVVDYFFCEVSHIFTRTQTHAHTSFQVYPGAFVYLYSVLYFVTGRGESIFVAQMIFVALLVATVAVLLLIFQKSRKMPLVALFLLLCSRRLHSIYVLVQASIVFCWSARNVFEISKFFCKRLRRSYAASVQRLLGHVFLIFGDLLFL